ncbi:MAG: hypothetical protein ACRD30_05415 [Bryobacteraceae bacterium]
MTALFLAALALGSPRASVNSTAVAPIYTADSIVNAAANVTGLYAPNTFISIYGQNLSRVTRAIGPGDITAGMLPTALTGTGVRVLINQIAADIYYVSPGQVNVLIPTLLAAGPATLQLELNGVAGPAVPITLANTAPALFQSDTTTVLAMHGDWTQVTSDSPARIGEEIVLYATGMGPTVPAAIPNQIPQTAALLDASNGFQILLNGVPVDPRLVEYAGAAPGFAGLFQINFTVPPGMPPNPEIRVVSGNLTSPPQRYLPVE